VPIVRICAAGFRGGFVAETLTEYKTIPNPPCMIVFIALNILSHRNFCLSVTTINERESGKSKKLGLMQDPCQHANQYARYHMLCIRSKVVSS